MQAAADSCPCPQGWGTGEQKRNNSIPRVPWGSPVCTRNQDSQSASPVSAADLGSPVPLGLCEAARKDHLLNPTFFPHYQGHHYGESHPRAQLWGHRLQLKSWNT